MRYLVPIAVVVLLSGCSSIRNEKVLAEVDRRVEAHMSARYDLDAVRDFLVEVVDQHPVYEGVSLASGRIGTAWRAERIAPGQRMRCGDWVLYDVEQGDEQFLLYCVFDEKNGRSVTIRSKRLSRDQFEFIETSIDEWVELDK